MILASTTDIVQVITGSAGTIDVYAAWADNASGVVTPGRTLNATISTATTTTVVPSPAASTQRKVKYLSIRNRDASVANTVTVRITDGTTPLQVLLVTLQPGELALYVDEAGWSVFTAAGVIKTLDTTAVSITGGTIAGTGITTKAGVVGGAGFTFASGTLATTPNAGDVEYDGVVAYFTPVAGERSVVMGEQFITQQGGTRALTSQTAAQKIFANPANGAVTVGGNRTYHFEGYVTLSSLSSTSGSFGFAISGTATFTFIEWMSTGNKAALATAASAQQTVNQNSLANTAVVTATTNTVGWLYVYGLMRVNAGGTVIPQVSLGVAAAAVVGQDSFFRVWPLGTGSVVSVGNWS